MKKEVTEPYRRTVPMIELEEIQDIAQSLGMKVREIEGDLEELLVEIEVTTRFDEGLTMQQKNVFRQAKIDNGTGWCG